VNASRYPQPIAFANITSAFGGRYLGNDIHNRAIPAMSTARRPSVFWPWFFGTALVLSCLLSVFIWKALQPPPPPLDVVQPK
jgi:hypothetical protein